MLDKMYGSRVYGVAVGCFADPDYPRPATECWASKRHQWLEDAGSEEVHAEVKEADSIRSAPAARLYAERGRLP